MFLGGLVVIFWLFSFIELIGVQTFRTWFYKIGLRAYHEFYEFPSGNWMNQKGNVVKMMHEGKYKFITSNECLFTSKLHWFEFFRWHTLFPMKGLAVINGNRLEISGRMPLGVTVFMTAFLVLNLFMYSPEDLKFSVLVCLFVGAIIFIDFTIANRRMKKMISDLGEILGQELHEIT